MADFWTKARLYKEVSHLRRQIPSRSYPFDSKVLVDLFCKQPVILEADFEAHICGMLVRKKKTTTIAVNAHHLPEQRNFYLAHEVFHYLWHDDSNDTVRFCNEGVSRNDYAEWQANEAAAELLMPYKLFVPCFVAACWTSQYEGSAAIRDAKTRMAALFGVTQRMIFMRIESLKHAISQYVSGTDDKPIVILSKSQQDQLKIITKSYNEIEAELERQEAFADQFDRYVRYRGF